MALADAHHRLVLERLEGRVCADCGEGELVRGRYRGNLAVVCDHCETPRAQFW